MSKCGELYSLQRRRHGLPARVEDLEHVNEEEEWEVELPVEWAGYLSPDRAEEIASMLMGAAREVRRRNLGACRACGVIGCVSFHPGQIREAVGWCSLSPGTQWLVVRETKRAWRLEQFGIDMKVVKYWSGDAMHLKLIGWHGPFMDQLGG